MAKVRIHDCRARELEALLKHNLRKLKQYKKEGKTKEQLMGKFPAVFIEKHY